MRQRVIYSGRVQGVGFRATARSIARRHPVSGFVRNQPDGTVWLEAQGPPDALAAFLLDLTQAMARNISSADALTIPDRVSDAGFIIAP